MKILWVAHRDPLNPRAGGAEKIIYEVGKRLSETGYSVTVFSGGWKECKRFEEMAGIKIHRSANSIIAHFALPIFLLKNHFDFVIVDLGHAVPWISPVLLKQKFVVSFLHLHARSLPGQVSLPMAKVLTAVEKLYPIIYRGRSFVTISQTSFADLKSLDIHTSKIMVVPPGVDNTLFKPSKKTYHPSIVYYGGLRQYKRPEEAVYILKDLVSEFKGIHLTIVGEGPEKLKLIKLVDEFDLSHCVTFAGRLTDTELADTVSASWLNIHTSVTEGWGISIIEAAAAGTPTVAYEVSGVSESVKSGFNGLLVPDGDRAALKNAAITVLNNYEKWSEQALEVSKMYSWDIAANSWIKIISGSIA